MAPGGSGKATRDQPKSKPPNKAGSKPSRRNAALPTTVEASSASVGSSLPATLYQRLLNVFSNGLIARLSSDLAPLLQQIKQHLYNRDFEQAFGKEEYLETYAVRWSSSRCLGYLDVFWSISENLIQHFKHVDRTSSIAAVNDSDNVAPGDVTSQSTVGFDRTLDVTCLGGGAGAEIVAMAGYLSHLQASAPAEIGNTKVHLTAVDVANWSSVVRTLTEIVTTAPPLSKYASEKAKTANSPLVREDDFSVTFMQRDILNLDTQETESLLNNTDLVTLMFTLNELYSISAQKTSKFLLDVTSAVRKGTLLLVLDSPGSYSTVAFNTSSSNSEEPAAGKKYPMQWLLDHTLLKAFDSIGPDGQTTTWKKVTANDSQWFRLPDGLRYPIELENMRYQIHLYERV